MAMPSKIDEQILLELVTKGLTQKEIAKYFDVRPSSVRSKLQTCSKRDARYAVAFGRKTPILNKTDAPLADRLDNYVLRMFSDAASVLNKLNAIPIPDDVQGLMQRTDLQLKGLQIVEKVHKHLSKDDATAPRTLNVTTISNYLTNKSENQDTAQVIDTE